MRRFEKMCCLIAFCIVIGAVSTSLLTVARAGGPSPAPGQPKTIVCNAGGGCNLATIKVGQSAVIETFGGSTRNSTSTLTPDANLLFTNMPAGVYEYNIELDFESSGGGEKWSFGATNFTTGSLRGFVTGSCNGASPTTVNLSDGAVINACTSVMQTTPNDWYHSGGTFFQQSGTPSTFEVQWAQNSSNAGNTFLVTQSYFTVRRVE